MNHEVMLESSGFQCGEFIGQRFLSDMLDG